MTPRLSRRPHCPSNYHQQRCLCEHLRMYHLEEEGVCKARNEDNSYPRGMCGCTKFILAPGYPAMEHERP